MKDVSFEGLEKELMQKTIDDKAERYLSLIQDLKSRKLGVLKSIDAGLRNNIDYMLPLLYAYKNQPDGNFDVFSYCGPVIQENPDIADEVVRFQPELIKDTIWMSDPDFIVKHLAAVPKLRQYLSTEMLNDEKVKAEIERIDQIDPMIAVGLGTVATMGGAVGILGVAYTIDQLEDLSMIPNLEEFQKEDFQYLNQVNEEKTLCRSPR